MSAASTVDAASAVNGGRPRFPRALRPGDTVAVMAPSSGVRPAMHGRLDAALALLRGKGFEVREGRSLRRQEQGASASGPERAAELMAALLDPTVAAVIPPWGGELAIEVLEHLDFDRLRDASPKWFSGFSDLSTIQLPLLVRAGWASLHGPNLMQLADPALDGVSARIFDAWASGAGAELAQPQAPPEVGRALLAAEDPLQLVFTMASIFGMESAKQQALLESRTRAEALRTMHAHVSHELKVLELRSKIASEAQSEMTREQREYVLRQQLRAIQEELGGKGEQNEAAPQTRLPAEA